MNLDEFLIKGYEVYKKEGKLDDVYEYLIGSGKRLFKEGAHINPNTSDFTRFVKSQFKEKNRDKERILRSELTKEHERLKKYILDSYGHINKKIRKSSQTYFGDELFDNPNIKDNEAFYLTKNREVIKATEYDGIYSFIIGHYEMLEEEKNNLFIKLYFTIDLDKINDFMADFGNFVIENGISTYFKSRLAVSNDMVTIRLYDDKYLDDVLNFIKKYKVNSISNPFMNTVDGIGIVLDDGDSYNLFICKLLCNYYENVKEINKETFASYVKDYMNTLGKSDFLTKCKFGINDPVLQYSNLENILENIPFDYDNFKEKFHKACLDKEKKIENNNEKFRLENKLNHIVSSYIPKLMAELVNLYIFTDEKTTRNAIKNILNNDKVVHEIKGKEVTVSTFLQCFFGHFISVKTIDENRLFEVIENIITEFNLLKELYIVTDPSVDDYEEISFSIQEMIDGEEETKYNLKLNNYENIDKIFNSYNYSNILVRCLQKYYNLDSYNNDEINLYDFSVELANKINVNCPCKKLLIDKSM